MKHLFLLFVIALFVSCSKKDTATPTNDLDYDIVGSVNLYDEGTTPVTSANMQVTILDTDPLIIVSTDNEGEYTLPNIPKGVYTLQFEKPNYGTFKQFDVEHLKNEPTFTTNTPSLGQLSTTTVNSVQTDITNNTLTVSATLDQDASNNNPKYIRVFFGSNSDLSQEKNDYVTGVIRRQINLLTIVFTEQELLSFGFTTGQQVYVNVAGDSYWSNEYVNNQTGKTIYPNLSWQTNTQSFTMP